MTIEQAIQEVDAAASLAQLNRAQHANVMQAIKLIRDEISKQNKADIPQESAD